MSLSQFLGLTHEIKIIDFLACNLDRSYTIDELQDFTDIDTGTIRYFLPRLQYNGLVEVDGENVKLCRNEITSALIQAVYANSFLIAEYPDGVDENNFSKH
jgi:DNA-binding IclR family transcriptional regulator